MESILHINHREKILAQLAKQLLLEPGSRNIYHGRIYNYILPPPEATWISADPPRNKKCPKWVTASEFCDRLPVMLDKVQYLARLLNCSKKTVVYSGAGLSTSCGVRQVAIGPSGEGYSGRSYKKRGYTADAKPSIAHYVLANLVKKGLIDDWVQLNHDGLAQKAGCPQEKVHEVHGSWYDPSNPVVMHFGTIRPDLFSRMVSLADSADLVLVLGCSLSGENHCLASQPATRSLAGTALGSVIINIQQTPLDTAATLRIFSHIDQVMDALARTMKIKIDIPEVHNTVYHQAMVPYDIEGFYSKSSSMKLNLTPGQKIRLNKSHNCQGSGQVLRKHIGQGEFVREKGRIHQRSSGVGRVVRYCSTQRCWELEVEGVKMMLGVWWLQDAARGGPAILPIVNFRPEVQNKKHMDATQEDITHIKSDKQIRFQTQECEEKSDKKT